MEKTLNELSEELTMKAHTDILCIIIDICIELVERNRPMLNKLSPLGNVSTVEIVATALNNIWSSMIYELDVSNCLCAYMLTEKNHPHFQHHMRNMNNFSYDDCLYRSIPSVVPSQNNKGYEISDNIYSKIPDVTVTPDIIKSFIIPESLRIVNSSIDPTHSRNCGITINTMMLAYNLLPQISLFVRFYMEYVHNALKIIQCESYTHIHSDIEDLICALVVFNNLMTKISNIPVGLIKSCRDDKVYPMYLGINIQGKLITDGDAGIAFSPSDPVLFVRNNKF